MPMFDWLKAFLATNPPNLQTHTSDESPAPAVKPAPKPKPVTKKRLAGRIICNDIGHGAGNRRKGTYDPGAVSGGWHEHKAVEKFVDELSRREAAEGAKVTISEDKPLTSRHAPAGADATSWHMNAGGGDGVEVFVPMLASKASRDKSDRIGRAIAAALGLPYRGTKRTKKWWVTNHGYDRLVELIFIDSKKNRDAFSARYDSAIAAIINII